VSEDWDDLEDNDWDDEEPTIEDRARFLLNALRRNERLAELAGENSYVHRADKVVSRRHLVRLQAMLDQIRAELGEDPDAEAEMARVHAEVEKDLAENPDEEGEW
jgi:hypothetical protein